MQWQCSLGWCHTLNVAWVVCIWNSRDICMVDVFFMLCTCSALTFTHKHTEYIYTLKILFTKLNLTWNFNKCIKLWKRHDSTAKRSEVPFLVMQPSDKQQIPSTMKVSYWASVARSLCIKDTDEKWDLIKTLCIQRVHNNFRSYLYRKFNSIETKFKLGSVFLSLLNSMPGLALFFK